MQDVQKPPLDLLVCVTHPQTGERLWVTSRSLRPGFVAIVDKPWAHPFARWATSPSGYVMDAQSYRVKSCVYGFLTYLQKRNSV